MTFVKKMCRIQTCILSVFFSLYANCAFAWDKAEGMRRHVAGKGSGAATILGVVAAVAAISFIVYLIKSSKK